MTTLGHPLTGWTLPSSKVADEGYEWLGGKPSGNKLDTGKPQMWLVPMESIRAIAILMTKALDKYPDKDNWKKIDNGEERYLNALLRHLCEIQEGIDIDEETGLPHAYAVGANALFYLYHYMKRQDEQDTTY